MIKTLISRNIPPQHIAETIKTLDMAAQISQLFVDLKRQPRFAMARSRRAAIMNMTNPGTGTITLHCTSIGNISIKAPALSGSSSQLYSVPGQSVLFAIDQPFEVQLYAVGPNQLEKTDICSIDQNNPLVIDGSRTLFDYCQSDAGLIGRINLPDRMTDIGVFDRVSLRKVAWLPHDDGAARHLVSLQLLEAVQDPERARVAGELIYHYHPAVAWKAFQVLYLAYPQMAVSYVALLKKHRNARLDSLLQPFEQAE
ncbi:hypothetical protein [Pseudomonas sp. RGM2987]|uniref:hypothetical protein n=1 Tax=Pseudomonas sp. RGM2987 TaxID=2930090 RepID=UPI001FD66A37|nr:hypothetical protein [Pseudomonas sp. RGM2987]MCJ8205028.1 hypothetical protein [Pseudomonas sp. RGM2987]